MRLDHADYPYVEGEQQRHFSPRRGADVTWDRPGRPIRTVSAVYLAPVVVTRVSRRDDPAHRIEPVAVGRQRSGTSRFAWSTATPGPLRSVTRVVAALVAGGADLVSGFDLDQLLQHQLPGRPRTQVPGMAWTAGNDTPIGTHVPLVMHRGRTSGRMYRTPVNAFRRTDDELFFVITYGPDVDWVRNVEAAGECDIETRRANRSPHSAATLQPPRSCCRARSRADDPSPHRRRRVHGEARHVTRG